MIEFVSCMDNFLEKSGSFQVTVSILNWNGGQNTIKCLEAIRHLDYPRFDVIVVDNNSSDDSIEVIRTWFAVSFSERGRLVEYPFEIARNGGSDTSESELERVEARARMVLIHSGENRGFSGGHNLAIQYLTARKRPPDAVLLLNNDAILKVDCIDHLVSVMSTTGAGIVGASVFDGSGQRMIFGGRTTILGQFFAPILSWQVPPPKIGDSWETAFVGGEAMLIKTSVIEDMLKTYGSWFDERLFMYGEVLLACALAARRGHMVRMSRQAIVYHDKAQSSGGLRNPLLYYYPSRNKIQGAKQILPLYWRWAFLLFNLLISSVRVAGNFVKGNKVGARAERSGVIDGYLGVSGKWQHHDEWVSRAMK